MRAAPALELTVAPDRAWRLGVSALLLAGFAALAAWAGLAASVPVSWRAAAVLAGLMVTTGLLACEAAARPLSLRWDGRCWHWREAPAASERSGTLGMAANFGSWLLLRLRSHGGIRWPWRARWVALGRRAHAAHWHALRCAVGLFHKCSIFERLPRPAFARDGIAADVS